MYEKKRKILGVILAVLVVLPAVMVVVPRCVDGCVPLRPFSARARVGVMEMLGSSERVQRVLHGLAAEGYSVDVDRMQLLGFGSSHRLLGVPLKGSGGDVFRSLLVSFDRDMVDDVVSVSYRFVSDGVLYTLEYDSGRVDYVLFSRGCEKPLLVYKSAESSYFVVPMLRPGVLGLNDDFWDCVAAILGAFVASWAFCLLFFEACLAGVIPACIMLIGLVGAFLILAIVICLEYA